MLLRSLSLVFSWFSCKEILFRHPNKNLKKWYPINKTLTGYYYDICILVSLCPSVCLEEFQFNYLNCKHMDWFQIWYCEYIVSNFGCCPILNSCLVGHSHFSLLRMSDVIPIFTFTFRWTDCLMVMCLFIPPLCGEVDIFYPCLCLCGSVE